MAKVIATCGKICCGKTTYAKKLQLETNAVILSLDEVMLALFPDGVGEMHDEYIIRAEQYLLNLSTQILATGVDVIFDWGLWTSAQRSRIHSFYDAGKISYEVHYLKINDDEWKRRIRKRNEEKPFGTYYVDEGLIQKANSLFQEPTEDEIERVVIDDAFELSSTRAQQILSKGVRKLRHPSRPLYIKEGYAKTDLSQKLYAAAEIKKQLHTARIHFPLMNEEDIVKFVFQGMMGVGHLVKDEAVALERLKAEIAELEDIESDEPLMEKLSPQWLRLNLRAAKRERLSQEDIAYYFTESAKMKGLSFNRQNVYNFCVKLDGSEAMKKVAERVLDKNYLPSHSDQYREAYKPAYRVLHKDFRKFRREEE